MSKDLTKKQDETLTFLKKYIVSHGFPPSVREICQGMGLSSPATAHTHLKELEAKGFIRKQNSKFRTIELLVDNEFEIKEEKEDVVSVPLLGKIACGNPIEAIENPNDFFTLPASLIPAKESIFTLMCSGDSMINVGIYDKDIVIVQKQKVAKNGDIVVAMTEDGEVTLKTFYKEKDHIRLQPENDNLAPIILSDCVILGKAIGLYRKI
ncbi:MAG: transcriptional repressor LexA [Erysipelotrichales bacterium]|nr:transcriptional repressor LexA [Erysipelotrichales bacterium]